MNKITMFTLLILIFNIFSFYTTIAENNKIKIVATIAPISSIAKEIGGDKVETYYLVPVGSDPHQYALNPEDVDKIRNCDLFISVGKEPFLGSIPEDIECVKLSWSDWIDAQVYIKNDNPHYLWLYPENSVKVAVKIYEALIRIDPGNKEYYAKRLEIFRNKVENLVKWINEYVTIAGVKGEKIVLAGAHFEPLAEAMKLKIVGILIKGEEKSPSPQEIAQIENAIKKENAKAIVVLATQKIGDEGRIAASISKDTGVPIVYVYGVMFSENDTYFEHIKYTITAITAAIEAGKSKSSSVFNVQLSYSTLVTSLIVLAILAAIETFILVRGR